MSLLSNISVFFTSLFARQKKIIEILKHDHKRLFKMYGQIVKDYEKKNFVELPEKIENFFYEYRMHILLEDNKFYPEIIKKYAGDSEVIDMVKKKKEEINAITEYLKNFVEQFKKLEDFEKNDFKKHLDFIGEALTKRVEFEEKELYPLY